MGTLKREELYIHVDIWLRINHRDCPIETVQKAFDHAKQFHEATFKGKNASESWLLTVSSMSDVLAVLHESQHRYDKKVASKSKKVKTVGKWWSVAASRINHYSQVVDTFVSSNPEYAALVWGAFKFLFQVPNFAPSIFLDHTKPYIADILLEILR